MSGALKSISNVVNRSFGVTGSPAIHTDSLGQDRTVQVIQLDGAQPLSPVDQKFEDHAVVILAKTNGADFENGDRITLPNETEPRIILSRELRSVRGYQRLVLTES